MIDTFVEDADTWSRPPIRHLFAVAENAWGCVPPKRRPEMATDEQGRIEELCQRIRVEQDLNTLCELIEELNRLLETSLENARSPGKRNPKMEKS